MKKWCFLTQVCINVPAGRFIKWPFHVQQQLVVNLQISLTELLKLDQMLQETDSIYENRSY